MMKNHFVTSVTSARFQSKGADLSILIVLPCILGIQVPPAFASDAMNQSARFVIGAQDIEAALHEWSRQTDIQVMVGATDAAGQRTEGVHGRLIAANALTQRLSAVTFKTYQLWD